MRIAPVGELGMIRFIVTAGAGCLVALISTAAPAQKAGCTYNNDGHEVCAGSAGSGMFNRGGQSANSDDLIAVSTIKFDPRVHADPSYNLLSQYLAKTRAPSQDEYYVPLVVDPKIRSTVSQLDCSGVTFQKWLAAVIGVQRGRQVGVSFTATYRSAFGLVAPVGDGSVQAIGSATKNLDTQAKLTSQCAVDISARHPMTYIRYGGASGSTLFRFSDQYVITVKTSLVQAAQLNMVASLNTLLSKTLAAAGTGAAAAVGSHAQAISAYSDLATILESGLQSAINGQFSGGTPYTIDAVGDDVAGVRVGLKSDRGLVGYMDIYALRVASVLHAEFGGVHSPSGIIRLRLFAGQSALDKLNTDTNLKALADGLNTKDPASLLAYCQSLRTFTSEALPLSTTDGALMRWAFLKYKGAFDSVVAAGGQGSDECFSSDDANLVKLMFPWTGVAPTQVAQQAAVH
jgi:hypothetical protein